MIECKHLHYPVTRGLCRHGVVYYGAWYNIHLGSLIVSFDVRSEDFGVIKLPEDVKIEHCYQTQLVNYHGKIALADMSSAKFDLWVLQDVKKQEWSKIFVLLPHIPGDNFFHCKGAISTGEIIFAPSIFTNPYFIIYYDLKGNNARKVEIEGVRDGDADPITLFMDHVESPMFLQNEV